MTINKKEKVLEEKEEKKEAYTPNPPLNVVKIIEDYFQKEDNKVGEGGRSDQEIKDIKLSCVESIKNQLLLKGRSTPVIRFNLEELLNQTSDFKLFDKFKEDYEGFISNVEEALINLCSYDLDFVSSKKKLRELHLIPDHRVTSNVILPIINDLSMELTPFRDRAVILKCRFMSLGLERVVEFDKLFWRCNLCGAEFERLVEYRQTTERYDTPSFCISSHCKARAKKDFALIRKKCKTYEKRRFIVVDIENRNIINEISCYISKNIPYFVNKAKDLHTNDELEIIGILKMDTADLLTQKEIQQPDYFIEVIDFFTTRNLDIDETEIKRIKSLIEIDEDFPIKIIDSIHPYSSGIRNFLPSKILLNFAWTTSDSFIEKLRNGINSIIGGHAGTLKTHIALAIQDILGRSNYGIIDGKNTTEKGLIPTAQRNNSEKDLQKRYGAFAYYNRKTLAIDEAHLMYKKNEGTLDATKSYEKGYIERALDGTMLNAECKGTLTFLVNYFTDDEAFDYNLEDDRIKNLLKNLGFPDEKSVLDRFDAHYRTPITSDRINQILVKRDSDLFKPIEIISQETIKNFLLEQKRLCSNGIRIPKDIEDAINKLYRDVISKERTNTIRTRNPREVRIIKKMLKAIAALHLREQVNEKDLIFLRKYLIDTVIPFQDIPYIMDCRIIDLDELFRNSFDLLAELHETYFDVSEFISFFKKYYEANFSPKTFQAQKLFVEEENESLSKNNQFRSLLDNNESYILSKGWIRDIMRNKTYFIEEKWCRKMISEKAKEIISSNLPKQVEISSMIPIIELELDFSKELIEKYLNQILEV